MGLKGEVITKMESGGKVTRVTLLPCGVHSVTVRTPLSGRSKSQDVGKGWARPGQSGQVRDRARCLVKRMSALCAPHQLYGCWSHQEIEG